jgi:hypothetical protein
MAEPPKLNQDPGRFRCQAFFAKMYGGTRTEVGKRLSSVAWPVASGKGALQITSVNDVHKRLAEVAEELSGLPKSFRRFFDKPGGTVNWRTIMSTDRLSPHSYGIAIDINPEHSDYWEWSKSKPWTNRIPWEVVEVFEKRNFVWGGKWFHYDTMHFEYRPELFPSPTTAHKPEPARQPAVAPEPQSSPAKPEDEEPTGPDF